MRSLIPEARGAANCGNTRFCCRITPYTVRERSRIHFNDTAHLQNQQAYRESYLIEWASLTLSRKDRVVAPD